MNRGGALFVDQMQYSQYPSAPKRGDAAPARRPRPVLGALHHVFVG